ncbi:hypothetical protein L211DRAFT_867338 [Terfezia boudieri ATCC MYA-4762]|uniref:Uncharacterized protein n=1 Tax=Terfezia boudieri ATCC MYA-4762 TaxID=1051890 RepID=A0A3N4LR16_9PEZI|nr:hypothetical protein L211DRAFT_867338 [Terfezia boudieri ATCC MYA-4762]
MRLWKKPVDFYRKSVALAQFNSHNSTRTIQLAQFNSHNSTRTIQLAPSQNISAWSRPETERLIAWMEDNQEELRGKQITWHKLVKGQVFADEDHITVKRITDKSTNMKRSWKDARAMQQRSGWGVKPEDNEASINQALERKCAFFWRLDEI